MTRKGKARKSNKTGTGEKANSQAKKKSNKKQTLPNLEQEELDLEDVSHSPGSNILTVPINTIPSTTGIEREAVPDTENQEDSPIPAEDTTDESLQQPSTDTAILANQTDKLSQEKMRELRRIPRLLSRTDSEPDSPKTTGGKPIPKAHRIAGGGLRPAGTGKNLQNNEVGYLAQLDAKSSDKGFSKFISFSNPREKGENSVVYGKGNVRTVGFKARKLAIAQAKGKLQAQNVEIISSNKIAKALISNNSKAAQERSLERREGETKLEIAYNNMRKDGGYFVSVSPGKNKFGKLEPGVIDPIFLTYSDRNNSQQLDSDDDDASTDEEDTKLEREELDRKFRRKIAEFGRKSSKR